MNMPGISRMTFNNTWPSQVRSTISGLGPVLLVAVPLVMLTASFVDVAAWARSELQGASAEFPGSPTAQSRSVETANGEQVIDILLLDVSEDKKSDNLIYYLSHSRTVDPAANSENSENLDGFFRGFVDGFVEGSQGRLIRERVIDYNGYPGREVEVDFGNGMAMIKSRGYLVKNNIYQLQTITRAKKYPNKSIDKFMDSFRLGE